MAIEGLGAAQALELLQDDVDGAVVVHLLVLGVGRVRVRLEGRMIDSF